MASSGESEDADEEGEKAKYESESPKTSWELARSDESGEEGDEGSDDVVWWLSSSSSVHSSPREMTAGGE